MPLSTAGIGENVTVVVPSYRRPAALASCVRSILDGRVLPSEIIIVGRQGDGQTGQVITDLQSLVPNDVKLRSAWVAIPGHIPPVETGARIASGSIVAILDDDVTVHFDWLDRLVSAFSDPCVGVVGGRTLVPGMPRPRLKGRPGQISWYGKAWGNIGSLDGDGPMNVMTVMEGNWAWRRALLASIVFDPELNFDDASMYGLDLCFQARRSGYRVVYEPRVSVDHHVAARTPELDRGDRPRRMFSYCRNYTYIMLRNSPAWRKMIFLSWTFLIGENEAWGAASLLKDMAARGLRVRRHVSAALRGKIEGIRLWLRS